MEERKIGNKRLDAWLREYPLLEEIVSKEEVFWTNPHYGAFEPARKKISLDKTHIKDAEERLHRFAPYLSKVFPETKDGIIESPLVGVSALQQGLAEAYGWEMAGSLWLKCDSHLPISGSIKARGGIYEVLKYAESLAFEQRLLTPDDDYAILAGDRFRELFSGYSIAVGSTGNLGLSIGIMGARLGFKVFVHMSSDAKEWKKEMLRQKGVTVVEYESDYSRAVEEGRRQAELDPRMHFIDDENSTDLFLGYAVAASRLAKQLEELHILVDEEHPLFVYLPCGVGGGPGGITFGLKQLFKDNVHCFFAEPVSSPCMLLGLMTRLHEKVRVGDFGLDNVTDADGLAVGTPSGFVGRALEQVISGFFTVEDRTLYKLLCRVSDLEKIDLEPSALAGLPGPFKLFHSPGGGSYLKQQGLHGKMQNATHIVWATGGSMVPGEVMRAYYKKGVGN